MARELNAEVGRAFAKKCESAAHNVLSAWASSCTCYHDNSPYAVKQFVLQAHHSWGTAYCDWSDARAALFNALKELGATNIAGKVKWNHVYVTFNMKPSLQKQLEAVKEEA